MKRLLLCSAVLALISLTVGSAHAHHLWPQTVGKSSVQLSACQGVNISIDSLINFASVSGRFDVNLYFANKLSPSDDSVANQQDPTAGPQQKFSSGDKIRVTLKPPGSDSGVSIVYEFDNPANVDPQPGISLSAVLHDVLRQGVDPEFDAFTNALVVGGIIGPNLAKGDFLAKYRCSVVQSSEKSARYTDQNARNAALGDRKSTHNAQTAKFSASWSREVEQKRRGIETKCVIE